MATIKLLHIHTDRKFVNSTYNLFNLPVFDNQVVIWGAKTNYNFEKMDEAVYLKFSKNDLDYLIKLCDTYNVIVLYNLDFWKSLLVNRLGDNKVIIWRFYGVELYNFLPIYSDLTLKFKKNRLENFLHTLYADLTTFVSFYTTKSNELQKAIKKINFFAGLSEVEYFFLKKEFSHLPRFIQLPYRPSSIQIDEVRLKKHQIIIGNSRSSANNHIDILNIIQNVKKEYSYMLFFSYGEQSDYSNHVKELASNIANCTLIVDFISINDFQEIYKTSTTLIFNGYRQMAIGNIMIAIKCGVKVYLNKKNVVYDWLNKEGFLVFSFDILEVDLNIGNVSLNDDEIIYNINKYNEFANKYSLDNFHKLIMQYVINN